MKTFVYLSILLLAAGAAFGIIDYKKAKNDGSFDKVYTEEPANETVPVNPVSPNNPVKKDAITVSANKTVPAPQKILYTVAAKNKKPIRLSKKTKAAEKMIAPKAPSVTVMEEPAVQPQKNEVAPPPPPPPPRRLNLRDFGRGSLKQRPYKKN